MRRRRFLAVAASSLAMGGCLDLPSDRQESPAPGSETATERNGSATATERDPDTPTEPSGPVRWRAGIGGRIPVPAVGDGSVYAVSTSGIDAFAAADGRRRWSHSTPQSAWLGPVVGDGVVYAAGDGTLAAFDATSGEERWQRTWSGEAAVETMPVVEEETVFVGISSPSASRTDSTAPEELWAVEKRDGSLRWKRDLGGRNGTGEVLSGPPVRHDGILYVQTRRGTAIALDPSDGSDRWRRRFDGTSGMGGPTLVAGENLFVVSVELRSGDRNRRWALVALGTGDGSERWRVTGIQTAPVSDGTTVYGGEIADTGGESTVVALSAADGGERWRFTKPGRLKTWSSLSTADGTLYASVTERTDRGDVSDDDSTLYAVGTDGAERWRFERRCEGFSRVVASAGTVYVAGRYGDGTLYALVPDG